MEPKIRVFCAMRVECMEPINYIDGKGWAYCTNHGKQRQQSQPCRKLKPFEVQRLQNGLTISYKPKPAKAYANSTQEYAQKETQCIPKI